MNQLQMLVTLSCGKKACLRLEYDHTTTCQPLFMKLEKVTKVAIVATKAFGMEIDKSDIIDMLLGMEFLKTFCPGPKN